MGKVGEGERWGPDGWEVVPRVLMMKDHELGGKICGTPGPGPGREAVKDALVLEKGQLESRENGQGQSLGTSLHVGTDFG